MDKSTPQGVSGAPPTHRSRMRTGRVDGRVGGRADARRTDGRAACRAEPSRAVQCRAVSCRAGPCIFFSPAPSRMAAATIHRVAGQVGLQL
jgi:hypothetical protein